MIFFVSCNKIPTLKSTHMTIHLQAKTQKEITQFFELLSPSIATSLKESKTHNQYHTTFELDFAALQQRIERRNRKQDTTVNKNLIGVIGLYRAAGNSFQAIADKMNGEGYRNSRGLLLNKTQVRRLHQQYLEEVANKVKGTTNKSKS